MKSEKKKLPSNPMSGTGLNENKENGLMNLYASLSPCPMEEA